jgi:hypothetical protein
MEAIGRFEEMVVVVVRKYISERLRHLEEYLPDGDRQSERSCRVLRQDRSDAHLNDEHLPPSPARLSHKNNPTHTTS